MRHAAFSLVPILLLGAVLAGSLTREVTGQGASVGRSEASLIAETAVEPVLDGRPLVAGLSDDERAGLDRLVRHAVVGGEVLRLRLRDLTGQVVYSDDESGFGGPVEDEVERAAGGATVVQSTRLNQDRNDSQPAGPRAVEVYLPLSAHGNRVGVLEIYLPYAPIQAELTAGLHDLSRDMALGLAGLWAVLFGLSLSVSRGLRRQVVVNRHQARHDALTGLPNRAAFEETGNRLLERAGGDDLPIVVALVDLDRFKEVNDTLGHGAGDDLLRQVGARLEEAVSRTGAIARLGGDEFGVIVAGCAAPDVLMRRLVACFQEEFVIGGLPLSVEASIGYALAPADGSDMAQLTQRADVAMYLAKGDHAETCRYDASRDHYDARRLALAGELRQAIEGDQLVLHYQPKVSLPDRRRTAVEALVRWHHPVEGLLGPDAFVPLAEQTDLIDNLTDWVLARALTDVCRLDADGRGLTVAVNVSARSLQRADFAERVTAALRRSGVAPDRLVIEITETALLVDPARAAAVLGRLASLGVTISIDDFGIGQTSLGYLSSLPVGELKVDRSFVTDMLVDPAHAAIVRAVIDLAHNLRFRVVAEGVESSEILERLAELGCDVAQGYHISRPVPFDALTEWLAASPKVVSSA